jgi:hypothetical protein
VFKIHPFCKIWRKLDGHVVVAPAAAAVTVTVVAAAVTVTVTVVGGATPPTDTAALVVGTDTIAETADDDFVTVAKVVGALVEEPEVTPFCA